MPRLLSIGILAVALALAGAGCSRPPENTDANVGTVPVVSAGPLFVDATEASGLSFQHFNGASGARTILEVTGAGCALFDADGDSDLDAYLVQGAMLGGLPEERATIPRVGAPGGRLFRNDLRVEADGTRTPVFTDVTEASGIRALGYGLGAATGDVDGDGDIDLFLTFYGEDQLWRNRGDGTFEDVTAFAGVSEPRFTTSASFFDADRDGDLDLFSTGYLDFRVERNQQCFDKGGLPDYCGPSVYQPIASSFYRNRGDGSFEDASLTSGIGTEKGPGLGSVAADLDRDGHVDVFVANDGKPNKLWKNAGNGRFENVAMLAGCALNGDGMATASMGIAAADFDDDGDDDIYYTNLLNEGNALQLNDGRGRFRDVAAATGLAAASLAHTAFGTTWIDFDSDSDLDLFVANGSVRQNPDLVAKGDPLPLRETNQLLENVAGKFRDISASAGAALALAEVSRGLGVGDVDEDGDLDLLIANNSGPARLLLNRAGDGKSWIGLRLLTGTPGRDALGATASFWLSDGRIVRRDARTDASIFSARDPRILVGLSAPSGVLAVKRLVVSWPDGSREEFDPPPTGAYSALAQGLGRAPATP